MNRINDPEGLLRNIALKEGLFKLSFPGGWNILELVRKYKGDVLKFRVISKNKTYDKSNVFCDIEYRDNGTWTAPIRIKYNTNMVMIPCPYSRGENYKISIEPLEVTELPLYMQSVTRRFEQIMKSASTSLSQPRGPKP